MGSHSLNKVYKIFIASCVVFTMQLLAPLTIALASGHVTPYVPYVSDCAGNFPESGIFSICLTITTILNLGIMTLRWLNIEDVISNYTNSSYMFMNSTGILLGCIMTLAFIAAAAFPPMGTNSVHNTAAGTACMCIALYMFCQSWLDMKLSCDLKITKIRVLLAIFCITSFVNYHQRFLNYCDSVAIFGVLGSLRWKAEHSVGLKTPNDEGFIFYIISSTAEWIGAILYFTYLGSLIPDLQNSVFQFRLLSSTKPKKQVATVETS